MEFPIGYEYRNSFRWSAVAALFLAFLGFAFLWPGWTVDAHTPAPHPYNSWSCVTGRISSAGRTFQVLGMSGGNIPYLERLCRSGTMAAHYDQVSLRWKTDEEARDATFLEMKYDLLAVKPSRLRSEEIGTLGRYIEIAQYREYGAWLIGHGETPRLETTYFEGKRLGLGSPLSESGRRILLAQFARADTAIDPTALHCTGFAGHDALRDAFEAREIDVFPSFWTADDTRRFPDARRLSIRDTLKPVTWYLRSDLIGTPAHCAIVEMVGQMARDSSEEYFKSLQVVRACN